MSTDPHPQQPPTAEDYATASMVMGRILAFRRAQETKKPGGYRPDTTDPLIAAMGIVRLYAEWWTPPAPAPAPVSQPRPRPNGQSSKKRRNQHKGGGRRG